MLLNQLSKKTQSMLQIAACLGAIFDEEAIEHVTQRCQSRAAGKVDISLVECKPTFKRLFSHSYTEVAEHLNTCVDKGLLVKIVHQTGSIAETQQFKFVHDHIQLAVYNLVLPTSVNSSHLKLEKR
jgi:predicted ATPase